MDVAELLEFNVTEFLLTMGSAGGGETRTDDVVTWIVAGSPIGYHNAVVRCHAGAERARRLVNEWIDELRARSLPGSWHLSPAMRPEGLAGLLTEAGFVDGGDEPAMAVELSGLSLAPRSSDHLDIYPVRGDDDVDLYRDVLAAGFGEGPKEADWVRSVWRTIGFNDDSPWQHLVGVLDGQAVATASVLMTGAIGGIYFVATHPDQRRRGFGTAITHRAMVEAASRGATHAVLGSSPMGHSVYERLGFRTRFSYRLFEFEP
jgi:ribosomal protein S18 acetylase RimI-like enzyme